MSANPPAERVDAIGLLCPLPILRAAAAIRRVPPGAVVELIGDDEGLLEDLPAWCEGNGHELLGLQREERAGRCVLVGRLRKAGDTRPGTGPLPLS